MEVKNYSSDSPVSLKNQDRFSRWKFSERIAQVISKRSDPSSIVIGLYGIWGDGKTSVLNFIEESLKLDENVICIKFNPWRFGTEEELLTGFFFDIAEALDAKLITTGDKLKDFVKKTAPGASSLVGAKGVGDSMALFLSGPDINELKKRIEKELETAKRRVLILIDDVDRLEKSEIHALFRLVKLTADFKYTSYILAFDKDVVAASLQDRYSSTVNNAGEAFLEKIIQVPLHLPLVEKQILRDFCFQCIDEAVLLAEISLSEQQAQEFARNFIRAFDDCLTTPRKAKLYGNILLFSLPILQGEVNPVDLMLIEGIRIFCPSLYETIRANKALFTTYRDSQYYNNEGEKEKIKMIIDASISIDKNLNKAGFISLLEDMFPKLKAVYKNEYWGSPESYKKWDQGQRICSENYFSRYFSYSVPIGDIADHTILALFSEIESWESPFEEEANPLNKYLDNKNSETLISKLRHKVSEISDSVSYKVAIALSQKSSHFPNPSVCFNWTVPFVQAAMLISDLIQNVKVSDRKKIAHKCIDIAPSVDFKLEIFRWLVRKTEDKPEKDAFSESSINEIGKYLGKCIESLLLKEGDITIIAPKSIPTVFYTLNKFIRDGYVNDYVKELVQKDSTIMLKILDSFVPTAWSMMSGISHKSDFERQQYDNLTNELDSSIVIKAVEENFPHLLDVSDEFPRMYDNQQENNQYLFVKQFIWLHQYVLREAEEKSKSLEKESEI